MNDKEYVVYLHRNIYNYKKYVGKTSQLPEQRWGLYGINYKYNDAFWSDIEKYGWDRFDHIIMWTTTSKEEAIKKEQELIAYFRSNEPEYGYNHTEGGDGMLGFNLSDETKEILRQSTIKKGHAKSVRCIETNTIYPSIEMAARDMRTKSKLISRCCHKGIMLKGYHFEFVEEKIMPKIKSTNKSKAVICLDTQEVFPSIKAAAKAYEIDYVDIRNCCHGRRPTAGRKHWKFYKEGN